MKSRARRDFQLMLGRIHPALSRLRHMHVRCCHLAESILTNAVKEHMNKCLPVRVKADGRPPGVAQDRIKLGVGPRTVPVRSTQEQARMLAIPEDPGIAGAAANRDGSRSAELDAVLGVAGASDLGSAVAIAEQSRKRHVRNFHGIWAQSEPGARFERKRLIRMSQQG